MRNPLPSLHTAWPHGEAAGDTCVAGDVAAVHALWHAYRVNKRGGCTAALAWEDLLLTVPCPLPIPPLVPCSYCREYQQYLHDAVATILFGEAGQRSSTAPSPGGGLDGSSAADGEAAVPGSWQSLPTSPRGGQPSGRRVSSLVPALQQQQAAQEAAAAGGGSAADATPPDADSASAGAPAAAAATAAAAAAQAAPAPTVGQSPAPSTRTVTQEELAAEQSGDWQVCSADGILGLLLLHLERQVRRGLPFRRWCWAAFLERHQQQPALLVAALPICLATP